MRGTLNKCPLTAGHAMGCWHTLIYVNTTCKEGPSRPPRPTPKITPSQPLCPHPVYFSPRHYHRLRYFIFFVPGLTPIRHSGGPEYNYPLFLKIRKLCSGKLNNMPKSKYAANSTAGLQTRSVRSPSPPVGPSAACCLISKQIVLC